MSDVLDTILDDLAERIAARMNGNAPAPVTKTSSGTKIKRAAAPAPALPTRTYTATQLRRIGANRDDLKKIADAYGISYVAKVRSETLISAILEAQKNAEEAVEDEVEEVEDEEEEEEDEEIEDEEEEEEDEEEDEYEDDDEEEYWTRDELQTKSLGELKSIGRDYGIKTAQFGKDKAGLIEEILKQ